MRLLSNMWASAGEMVSFTNVVNPSKSKDQPLAADTEAATPATGGN